VADELDRQMGGLSRGVCLRRSPARRRI
jgi:hypothetical protein